MRLKHVPALALAIMLAGSAAAQDDAVPAAAVALKDSKGAIVGQATLTQTPAGVLVSGELTGLPPGVHAFHFHETGVCEPPFESAGDHYNPTAAQHGYAVVGGPHAGDMPNLHVPDSGAIAFEFVNPRVSLQADVLETLFDDDGTSLVLHAGADDYHSQPSGNAGDRLACGVVEKQG